MKESSHPLRLFGVLTHFIGWGIVFGLPLFFFSRHGEAINWADYLRHCVVPCSLLVVFYLNYFLLIPRYLFGQRIKEYLLINIVLLAGVSIGLHIWQEYALSLLPQENPFQRPGPPTWVFFVRDNLSLLLTVGLSAAIRITARWGETEVTRREAERIRTEAELTNLRNQLNPHFLLNTLNNIYALIAFDTDKAQLAVQELSRLLRHVLYDNQQNFVSLNKEMDFIRNYIELMRIRLTANVEVETSLGIAPESRTQIAPLIFISLIENAFKHGISPSSPSFIRITFFETPTEVHCEIRNSYHPKNETDKSGSGIGLEQVSKRLELLYPGRHEWQRGLSDDRKEYYSHLIIQP